MVIVISIFCNELLKLKKILKSGIRTRAKRIGFTTVKDVDGDKMHIPMIEFYDPNGHVIRTKIYTSMNSKRQDLDIIYSPKNPKEVIPDNWTKHIPWLFGVLVVVFCILFLVVKLVNR